MTEGRLLLLRSMLFVPGDSEKKLAKARDVRADALILDLEDSVAAAQRPRARALVAEFLAGERRPSQSLWVRVNALDDPDSRLDLERVVPARPDGIVLPKPRSAEDVVKLDASLDRLERRGGLSHGSIRILPIATETPRGVFELGGYAGSSPRLAALTWGAEDLSVAVGAVETKDERGDWLAPYQLARSLCLIAAAAAGVPAVDTVYTDFRDEAGLLREARTAKRDGFVGKLAIHPDQVEVLNRTFQPSAEEVDHARRVVDAFAAAPGAGTVALDGRMLDRPHLERSRRTLALAKKVSDTISS